MNVQGNYFPHSATFTECALFAGVAVLGTGTPWWTKPGLMELKSKLNK